MKLWILSDLHMEKRSLLPVQKSPDFDVLVCAGDIFDGNPAYSMNVVRSFAGDRPAVFVSGNHEYWHLGTAAAAIDAARAAAARTGVHFLERDTVVIGGVTFAGATLRDEPPAPETVSFLEKSHADVVVTHFPPSPEVFARVQASL
ncbi:MAG: metallophosphoesterase [Pseudorhodoplanes sp.]|nr:metallophosphoesterase [Pseudorhodoplanes sp.]